MILVSTKQVPRSEQRSHAHLLLKLCLKEYGVDYDFGKTPVTFGEHGKPSLSEHPGLRYNISHADGIAAAMVSEYECGIDCERIRPSRTSVFRRCYSEPERRAVEEAPEAERDLLFFRLWTLKEAFVKASGKGLLFPLRNAEFMLDGEKIITELSGCAFSQHIIDQEFVLSVCTLSDKIEPHIIRYL